jgi:hypothetical protein
MHAHVLSRYPQSDPYTLALHHTKLTNHKTKPRAANGAVSKWPNCGQAPGSPGKMTSGVTEIGSQQGNSSAKCLG